MSDIQKLILKLLQERDFVLVSGAYIGHVLALQVQGLVTSKPIGEGKLEVKRRERESDHA